MKKATSQTDSTRRLSSPPDGSKVVIFERIYRRRYFAMRPGWSVKAAGEVLGVHPNKVPQAMEPALTKVARLMLADPHSTWIELLEAMERVRRDEAEEAERAKTIRDAKT